MLEIDGLNVMINGGSLIRMDTNMLTMSSGLISIKGDGPTTIEGTPLMLNP